MSPFDVLERQAEKLIANIQPCERSQQMRQEVFQYVASMVKGCFSDDQVLNFFPL
jgi:hypothetical protein